VKRSPQRKHDAMGSIATYMPTALRGIANRAKREPDAKFGGLANLLTADNLKLCFEELRKDAAPGVDRVTVQAYRENLETNIADLVERLKTGRYRAGLVRRRTIPKGRGKTRPLGIPVLEDKLLQVAVKNILNAIYESEFLNLSWGYRPGRGARDASKKLAGQLAIGRYNYVVDADLRSYFDTIDHGWLIRMLELRIADRTLLRLIRKWLKAGILEEDGAVIHPATGTPQGGVVSPVLANVYLHYVLDLWFTRVVRKRAGGQAMLFRYADDFVAAFERKADADAFMNQLPERVGKFGLTLSEEKTALVHFSRYNSGAPGAGFNFLGFRYHWERTRNGRYKVQRMTSPERRQASERVMREWVRRNRHLKVGILLGKLHRRLTGYWNYYGVTGNFKSLQKFWREVQRILYKWLNRRSQRRSYTWKQFFRLLKRYGVPAPRIKDDRQATLWLSV